ncbi:MAG TPA: phosphatase PAP2 family protein [Allosphingosinicella sp.]|jgi:undecaprenyl-diphosphatase
MDTIVRLSDWLYLLLNGLAGRSWLLDTLISLPLDNNLVKAGPIGACFVYAWWSGGDEADIRRRRSTLLVTVASLLFVMASTKTIADGYFQPRPFVHAQQAWHIEEGKLVETPRLAYREPLNGGVRNRYEALKRGEIEQNDLGSFPSDHAGFFFALALGIFLASRRAGAVALAWTVAAILLPRIVTGMHSPLDIVAGAGIGAAVLLAIQFVARRTRRWALEPLAGWTLRHEALAAALLFFVAFESTNVLTNVRDLAGTGEEIVEHVAGS